MARHFFVRAAGVLPDMLADIVAEYSAYTTLEKVRKLMAAYPGFGDIVLDTDHFWMLKRGPGIEIHIRCWLAMMDTVDGLSAFIDTGLWQHPNKVWLEHAKGGEYGYHGIIRVELQRWISQID